MKKIEVIQEGLKIQNIVFDIYSKLNETNLIKLNLSNLENSKISIYLPLEITESLDILNVSSGYYNDICYITETESKTDIIIKDRKKEFIEGNKTICQNDCIFYDYDYKTKLVHCSCKIKESSSFFLNKTVIDVTKFFENFIDIKNVANLNLLICYKSLFIQKSFIKNIGSYIIIIIIIIHSISIIVFYSKQIDILTDIINDIAFSIKNLRIINS